MANVCRRALTQGFKQLNTSVLHCGRNESLLAIQKRFYSSRTPEKSFNSSEDIIFRQLFDRESCTLSYLLGCGGEAVLVDPVLGLVERDLRAAEELGLKLKYCVNTHVHADHITGSGLLKQRVRGSRSVVSAASGAMADVLVGAGDVLTFGGACLEVRDTPGHTNGCITLVLPALALALTGDALLIRGCGRTDFQEGDPAKLYRGVHSQIFSLPDHYRLYPAHDYQGQTMTTVREEKLFNPRLTKSLPEFVEVMNNLNLPYPAKIDVSLPANRVCGLHHIPAHLPQPAVQSPGQPHSLDSHPPSADTRVLDK